VTFVEGINIGLDGSRKRNSRGLHFPAELAWEDLKTSQATLKKQNRGTGEGPRPKLGGKSLVADAKANTGIRKSGPEMKR